MIEGKKALLHGSMTHNRLGCNTSPLNKRHKKLLGFLVLLKDKLVILLWPELKRAIHGSIMLRNSSCSIFLTVFRFLTYGSIKLTILLRKPGSFGSQ